MLGKTMSFEIDANQIDIKPILRKDFLELRMKAISTANPNRNGSWFTKESLERSIGTFRNKPILGYFENGDFVSHNGEWKEDQETGMDYWDTLGKRGERILGLIRSEDEIKIVEDKKGLSWIVFSCALWTQYSFKQVKRLLKDAKRAQKTGESTKNISVEVDITDYETLDNGIIKINAFDLVGVTILGSRNGIKVEPGIEDAELSVVDIMGRELYERQAQSVRLAYEKLDGSDEKKEEFQEMENKLEEMVESTEEKVESVEEPKAEVEVLEENFEEKTSEVEEPVVEEVKEETQNFEDHEEPKEEEPEEDGEEEEDHDEDGDEEEEEKKEELSAEEEPAPEVCPECGENPCVCEEKPEEEPVECECDYKARCEELEAENCELKEKCEGLEKELSEKNCKLEEVSGKLCKFETEKFLKSANKLIKSAQLSEEKAKEFYDSCVNGEIKDLEDLKVKVALAVFENNKVEVEEDEDVKEESFETKIEVIDTQSVFETATKKVSTDKWSNLKEYIEK